MASESKIKKIVKIISNISKSYGIRNSYIVGGYPRSIIMNNVKNDVNDLDFASAWPGEATKLGSIAASELIGELPEIYHRTGTIKFSYEGIDLEFQGSLGSISNTEPIMNELINNGISISPLTLNIYSRDFTINTICQDLNNLELYDITGFGVLDINNKIIRTPINPDVISDINSLILLRAIKFSLRYNFRIEESLRELIESKGENILKDYSPERIQLEILKMLHENYEGTLYMINEYNLKNILKNDMYDIFSILENIDITKFNGDLASIVKGENI